MNKKILAAAIAAFLMTPVAFAAYVADTNANTTTTDDADDTQTLTIIVPEVALIDINDATVALDESTLITPTNAGDGFTGSAVGISNYAISSNVANTASPTLRKLEVKIDTAVGAVPAGARLVVDVTAPAANATSGAATFTSATTTPQPSVIDIGNTRGTGLAIEYTLDAEPSPTGTGMIAYTSNNGTTSDNIGLVYTLSDD